MKILCNIITGAINDLAKQINKSPAYTCNLVSTWQTKNQSAENPTAAQLKELISSSKQEAMDAYFAVPNYEVREYDPKIIPIEHVNGMVYLMKFPSDNPMEYFFKHYGSNNTAKLKEVIRNNKEAYQYVLWREMAFIQHGLDKTVDNRAIAETEALNKAIEYAKRNPIKANTATSQQQKKDEDNHSNTTVNNKESKISSTIAPYFETTYEEFAKRSKEERNKMKSAFLEHALFIAKALGITLSKDITDFDIGGYTFKDGGSIVEPSYTFNINTTLEKARLFTVLMGDLGYEQQDDAVSYYDIEDENEADGIRWSLEYKDSASMIALLNKFGIKNFTYNKTEGVLSVLSSDVDDLNKLNKLLEQLNTNSNGTEYKLTATPFKSSYDTQKDRRKLYEEWSEVHKGESSELDSLIQKALNKLTTAQQPSQETKQVVDTTTPTTTEQQPQVGNSEALDPNNLPDVGVEVLNVNKDNPMARMAHDFSAVERDNRVHMIAREFSNIIDRLLDQKVNELSDAINEEMSKEHPDVERIQVLNEKISLFKDDTKNRKAIIGEVGPYAIFDMLKAEYESYANMSAEELDEDYGEGQGERMLDAYQRIVNNFDSLLDEAAVLIENAENLRIVPDKHPYYNGNEKKDVLDAKVFPSTNDESHESSEFEDDEDGNRVEGNGGWSFKVRLVDPRTSLSKSTKKVLSNIKRETLDGSVERDDLGNIRYLEGDTAYNILMDGLSGMINADDFVIVDSEGKYTFPALEALIPKYPWVRQVINTLVSDPSMVSSFFADFRKDFIPYSMSYFDTKDEKWKDKKLNSPTALESTRTDIVRNYEQGIILDDDSVYDTSNNISTENADKGLTLTNGVLSALSDSIYEEDIEGITKDVSKGLRMLGLNINSNIINNLLQSDNGIVKLEKVVNAMKDIFYGSKDMKEGSHLVQTFDSEYTTIASIVGEVNDLDNVASFRQAGKSYYSYSAPNYIDTVIKKFKSDNRRQEYIDNYFKKYNWFYNNGKWSSEWLNLIENDEDVRYQMRLEDVNTINGVEYEKWEPQMIKDAFIRKYFAIDYNKSSKKQFAWYNFPIFSDSPVTKFIKFLRYTGDYRGQITPLLREVVKQELRRIKLVQERAKNNASQIASFDKNGSKFNFFPEFNNLVVDGVPFLDKIIELANEDNSDVKKMNELIDSAVNKVMEDNFNTFISPYVDPNSENGVTAAGAELMQSLLDNGIISSKGQFLDALGEYFWNQAYATTQIIELATTDLAFYKDDVDFQKRFKEVYAAGTKLNTNSKYGRKFETTVYLADNLITSTSFNSIKKSLQDAVNAGHILEEDMKSILKAFKGVNVADAQAFRSLDSMRAILDMMGMWTPEMQATMDRFDNGTWDMSDFNTIWQTIKPFVYTQIEKPDGLGGVIKVPHQNKNSEFLLLSMYNMVANSLSSPKMRAINRFMRDNNIDVVQFESAVKAGKQGIIDINYSEKKLADWAKANNKEAGKKTLAEQYKEEMDNKLMDGSITQEEYNKAIEKMSPDEQEILEILEKYSKVNGEYNPEVVHQIPYDDYVVQQPTPEHLFDVDAVFGSQFRNLIISDMPNDPSFRVKIGGKEYTKEQVLHMYQANIVENLLDDFDRVKSKFTDIYSLQKALLDNIKGNPKYGRDMINALQIVEVTNPFTGEKEEVFNIPLDNPSTTIKIQELVTSMFKNGITKQYIKGGACILVSSFGYTDKLHTVHNEDGSIKYMECYLPAYSRKFFEPFMVEKTDSKTGNKYMELDVNMMPENLRKIIGYRIPTEDKYSMAPLYIKGFMPQQNGSAVMLPADTTIFSGEDYDVDKKFLMIPEFRVYTHNMVRARQEYEKENNIINSTAGLFRDDSALDSLMLDDLTFNEWWKSKTQEEKDKFKYDKPHVVKVKYDESKGPQGNSRAARNNFLIDIAWGILTNKDTAEKIHNPGSFDKAKLAARIATIVSDPTLLHNFAIEKGLATQIGPDEYDFDYEGIGDLLIKMSEDGKLDELNDFISKYRTVRSQLTADTFIYNHRQNMTGAALIGMYANNTTMQAKFQVTGLSIKDNNVFMINGRRIKSLHDITSGTGERISKNCANFSAASVDNVKDPVLADLMQNTETANITGFMLRAGMSIQEIGLMFSQPIIRKCIKNTGSLKTLTNYIDAAISSLDENGGGINLNTWQSHNFSSKELIMNIINSYNSDYDDMSSTEYNEFLASNIYAAHLMTKIVKMADDLSTLTQISRADSPNGAISISISGAKNQVQKVNNYVRNSKGDRFTLTGIEDIMKNEYVTSDMSKDAMREKLLGSTMPMLQAFYSLGIEMGTKILSPYFMQTTDYANGLVQEIYNNHRFGILSDSQLDEFYSEMIKFGLTKTKLFGDDDNHTFDEKRDFYLYDYPNRFLKVKADNPDIANLSAIKKMEVINGQIFMRNSGRLTPLMKDTLMRDFDTLLYMDNPAAQKLAVDLFLYSFYKDGFKFGPNNFGTFFSTNFINSFPEFINALRLMKFNMKNGTYFDRFLPQYYANHWADGIVPDINVMLTSKLADGSIMVKTKDAHNYNIVPNSNSQHDIKSWKIIKVSDPVNDTSVPYILNREGKETAHYVPMSVISDIQGAKYNANMTAEEMSQIKEDSERIEKAKSINSNSAQTTDAFFDDSFAALEEAVNIGGLDDYLAMEEEKRYSEEAGEAQLDEPLCK